MHSDEKTANNFNTFPVTYRTVQLLCLHQAAMQFASHLHIVLNTTVFSCTLCGTLSITFQAISTTLHRCAPYYTCIYATWQL